MKRKKNENSGSGDGSNERSGPGTGESAADGTSEKTNAVLGCSGVQAATNERRRAEYKLMLEERRK